MKAMKDKTVMFCTFVLLTIIILGGETSVVCKPQSADAFILSPGDIARSLEGQRKFVELPSPRGVIKYKVEKDAQSFRLREGESKAVLFKFPKFATPYIIKITSMCNNRLQIFAPSGTLLDSEFRPTRELIETEFVTKAPGTLKGYRAEATVYINDNRDNYLVLYTRGDAINKLHGAFNQSNSFVTYPTFAVYRSASGTVELETDSAQSKSVEDTVRQMIIAVQQLNNLPLNHPTMLGDANSFLRDMMKLKQPTDMAALQQFSDGCGKWEKAYESLTGEPLKQGLAMLELLNTPELFTDEKLQYAETLKLIDRIRLTNKEKLNSFIDRLHMIDKERLNLLKDALFRLDYRITDKPQLVWRLARQSSMFYGGTFNVAIADQKIKRLNSLPEQAINQWVSVFGGDNGPAALTLIQIEELFVNDSFQAAKFAEALPTAKKRVR